MLHKPVLDALLFSLAIAVGVTPQLLPAVVATSLSAGMLHFTTAPWQFSVVVAAVVVAYLGRVEIGKRFFCRSLPTGAERADHPAPPRATRHHVVRRAHWFSGRPLARHRSVIFRLRCIGFGPDVRCGLTGRDARVGFGPGSRCGLT